MRAESGGLDKQVSEQVHKLHEDSKLPGQHLPIAQIRPARRRHGVSPAGVCGYLSCTGA